MSTPRQDKFVIEIDSHGTVWTQEGPIGQATPTEDTK